MAYQELRVALRSRRDLETGAGATEDEIHAAEAVLGSLPGEYREFLREFGWVSFGAFEVHGLGARVPAFLDVVRVTVDERERGGLPSTLIPVMNDGGGNLYCIDGAESGSTTRIVLWDHELSPTQGEIHEADSFSEWLIELVQDPPV